MAEAGVFMLTACCSKLVTASIGGVHETYLAFEVFIHHIANLGRLGFEIHRNATIGEASVGWLTHTCSNKGVKVQA